MVLRRWLLKDFFILLKVAHSRIFTFKVSLLLLKDFLFRRNNGITEIGLAVAATKKKLGFQHFSMPLKTKLNGQSEVRRQEKNLSASKSLCVS